MIEIFNYPQNSPDWFQGRCGLWTCSNAKVLGMKGRGGGESETRKKLIMATAAEIISGRPAESFSTADTERGHEEEEENRNRYAYDNDVEPQIVGFIRNGRKGGSPDALVGDDGILECKSHKPTILIPMMQADMFPAEHVPQCQALLWVCEREWCDLSAYSRGLPRFQKRIYRDEAYIKTLADELERFYSEVDQMVDWLKGYGVAA